MGEGQSKVLVLGFGPFQEVRDNPAARLAHAVDGARAGSLRVIGRVLPVSYQRCFSETVGLVAQHTPVSVLCVGVARGRPEAVVECLGQNVAAGIDVDGVCPEVLEPEGPPVLAAPPQARALADALCVATSQDAGQYVCNAWLYRALWWSQQSAQSKTPLAVCFLHIPDRGFAPSRLLEGLAIGWDPHRVPGPLS